MFKRLLHFSIFNELQTNKHINTDYIVTEMPTEDLPIKREQRNAMEKIKSTWMFSYTSRDV